MQIQQRLRSASRARCYAGPARRRGAMLPLLALCLVGMIGLVALAIDVGMMVVRASKPRMPPMQRH